MMSSLERKRSCKKAGSDLALCSAGLVYWFQEHLITCWINILLPCSQTELFTSVYISSSNLPDGAWLHSFGNDLPIRCYPICCRVTWSLTRSAAPASARSHLLHVSNLPFCKYPLTWQKENCNFFFFLLALFPAENRSGIVLSFAMHEVHRMPCKSGNWQEMT